MKTAKGARVGALLPLALILALEGRASAPQEAASPAGRSVLDGVFTSGQATRGQRSFEMHCEACHRSREFTGELFLRTWMSRTVGDLFQVISDTMPPEAPGNLSATECTDLVAYVLRLNGYPAGQEELPADRSTLATVRFEEPTKGGSGQQPP